MEQTHPYVHKSEEVRILKLLRQSRALKIKKNWSRETSPGFISEDIQTIKGFGGRVIEITTPASRISVTPSELNLRETEECIKFLEIEDAKNRLEVIKAKYPKTGKTVPDEAAPTTNEKLKSTNLVDGTPEKSEKVPDKVMQSSLQVDDSVGVTS